MTWLLSKIDWNAVRRGVRAETRSREVHQPLVSLFRWWARRPHTLIGAILEAADLSPDGGVVLDPFSGGGTVAVESARRGLSVFAQDLNPWAAWGLAVALRKIDPAALRQAGAAWLERLRQAEGGRYRDPSAQDAVAHTFRVRTPRCAVCMERYWKFPYALVSVASRATEESRGYYGCRRCGVVSRHHLDSKTAHCPGCGYSLRDRAEHWCPTCHRSTACDDVGPWAIVLVQRYAVVPDGRVVFFDAPCGSEATARGANGQYPSALRERIPNGIETAKLLNAGFREWSDLYPRRQLGVLLEAARILRGLKLDEALEERLLLCLAGAVEMPGHLCRWDRFHPKAFEGLANHRYSFDGLAVEPNPLAPVGRGSLERRIAASVAAAEWAKSSLPSNRRVTYSIAGDGRQSRARKGPSVAVVQGSSETIPLASGSAAVVVTDPPYYDSVQYGELASLFLTWTRALGMTPRCGEFQARREAVPNRRKRKGLGDYQRKLQAVFAECSRTLKPGGKVVLTYHSTDLRAWWALGHGLHLNGFRIGALVAAETENGTDHAKRGKRSFVCDLLFECVRSAPSETATKPKVLSRPCSAEQRELVRIGLAMAAVGCGDYSTLREEFNRRCVRMRVRRIETPDVRVRSTSSTRSSNPSNKTRRAKSRALAAQ